VAVFVLAVVPSCTCSKTPEATTADAGDAASASAPDAEAIAEPGGLSAPIAAARVEGGDIVVAGLDVPAKAIRVQRIDANEAVIGDKTILDGLKWSSDADLKVAPAGKGAAITWRGLRNGKLVRQLVILGADLVAKGEPIDVTAASCATQDAIWYTDGKRAFGRTWAGQATKSTIPGESDVSVVCGAHRAFALLDEDDGASFIALGGGGDAGAGDGGAAGKTRVFEESSFGEDDQRERGEFTVGDDLGVVRLSVSGSLAIREVRAGVLSPMRKLKTTLPRDADVVAVDASPRTIVIVYTDDAAEACTDAGTSAASTKVSALRIDRTGEAEENIELSPGVCGVEIGPFFTGAVGDTVSVAWVERVAVVGQPRAPITGIAHRLVPAQGAAPALGHIDQPADALVDAGCDSSRCYAVALARKTGMDAMVPGLARVLRYP
jgi:hypothetical protein